MSPGATILLLFPAAAPAPGPALSGSAGPLTFCGPFGSSFLYTPTPPDLLSAVVYRLRHSAEVAAVLTSGGAVQVWTGLAPAGQDRPFCLVHGYREVLPGLSPNDEPVEVCVEVHANGLDQARTVAAVVKSVLDTPGLSGAALGRPALSFSRGIETAVVRDASRPRRLSGTGKGGTYCYAEEIRYRFFVTPNL